MTRKRKFHRKKIKPSYLPREWSVYELYKRCDERKGRVCNACKLDKDARPHGPYYELRRYDARIKKYQIIYVGRMKVPDRLLQIVNDTWERKDLPTQKRVQLIREAIEQARKRRERRREALGEILE
jgi:hypothetical protein